MNVRQVIHSFLIILLSLSMMTADISVQAYAPPEQLSATTPGPSLKISESDRGLTLEWTLFDSQEEQIQAAAIDAVLAEMPRVRFGGYDLPMQLQTVILSDDHDAEIELNYVESRSWAGIAQRAAPLVPKAIGWDENSIPVHPEKIQLPTESAFILREGIVRGHHVAVVAISPIHEKNGQVEVASRMQLNLLNAASVVANTADLLARTQTPNNDIHVEDDPAPGPTNLAATTIAVKIHVTAAGIQSIKGANLIPAGIPSGRNLQDLYLTHKGNPIAIEIRDIDGFLSDDSEIRFFAPAPEYSMIPGDFWNAEEIYWLTLNPGRGIEMVQQTRTPDGAPLRTVGIEQGIWENNGIYRSQMPGVDGDHWFGARIPFQDPENVAGIEYNYSLNLNHRLPLAIDGTLSTLLVSGSTKTKTTNTLQISLGDMPKKFTWKNLASFESFSSTVELPARSTQLQLTLEQTDDLIELYLDKVDWKIPVHLDFGGQGATFSGFSGAWRYQLRNTPENRTLYDVTVPSKPQIVTLPPGSTVEFQDEGVKDYLVAGPGTLHVPSLESHAPVNFPTNTGAEAIYIAPALFHDELIPLVAHRQSQGYSVKVIDVEDIYDAWSFGLVSPVAIRDFLRFARKNWSPKPIAFTTVGDSTVDPKNYMGRQDGIFNVNIIPAYLAYVDPWEGQTVCQNCLAQLDKKDPLDDEKFLIDIWPGVLSVQNEEQLGNIVDKILRYETAADRKLGASWRQTSLFVSDDFVRKNGEQDSAGDFLTFSDKTIEENQSPKVITERVYYDPLTSSPGPGRYADAVDARNAVFRALNRGPAHFAYNGHANHFQLAVTEETIERGYLLGFNDILDLRNRDQLTIALQMTCRTSQYSFVSKTGTTIDERLLRHPLGGAVAVWGGAGLTVAHGHEPMIRGYQEALWSEPRYTARIGELVQAGYLALFDTKGCCQSARYSFLLQGDPLMPVLAHADDLLYLPLTAKSNPVAQ
ncbi:hypothetical protein KFU94_31070 [Chloroflexi bacterium TSY]|nr:hypothetical protein [Chloroflexi bacterium TSY]